MNAAMENILTRRSVRAFEEKKFPEKSWNRLQKRQSMPPADRISRPGRSRWSQTGTRSRLWQKL